MQSLMTQIQTQIHNRQIPPLEQWNPEFCGSMDLVIKANGEWWHEGRKIERQSLIALFSKVLCFENNHYYLKTPVEKIQIQVEDAPLQIKEVQQQAGQLYFITTQDDEILLDAQHHLEMRYVDGQYKPYLYVRYGLWASLNRAVFYHLIDLGELQENAQGDTILKLVSGDFELILTTPSQE